MSKRPPDAEKPEEIVWSGKFVQAKRRGKWEYAGRPGGMRAAVILAVPLFITYLDTGLVPRFPTAILATGMVIVSVLSFFAGLILDTVTRGRREMRRLAYLAHPAPIGPAR